ncbi:MAG: hypothetical protein MUC87_00785 [Bacteroidia bacterium]|jgi:hypothetical protein|nr:hypothetical protein [Bacteroidia bacterium]
MYSSYGNSPFDQPGFLIGLAIVLFIILAITLAIYIPFIINLSNALKQVAPHNRKISPGQMWLILIPIFGTIWAFIIVPRIADSLVAEYQRRRMHYEEERLGYQSGMAWAVLGAMTYIRTFADLAQIPFIGAIGSLAGLGALIFFIVYWVKIARYKNELRRSGTWEQFMHAETAGYGQNPQQPYGQPNWNQPGYNQNPPQQPNWNQPGYNQNPPQQPNWNQPPATPPQQNWTPPSNPQNPPPPADPNNNWNQNPPGNN